ncbi:MAG TPA: CHASE3 domain-containing protein [Opitutaceae bacterium]|nr:CHASE3 domain-containing protein [Opitutaceae bacterium]
MAWIAERKIIIATTLTLLAFFSITGLAYFSVRSFKNMSGWVIHTHDVHDRLKNTVTKIPGEEAAQRGFIIAGQDQFADFFKQSIAVEHCIISELRSLTQNQNDSGQQRRLDRLEEQIDKKTAAMMVEFDFRRISEFDTAANFVQRGESVQLTEDVRRKISEMLSEEDRLLAQRGACNGSQKLSEIA